MSSRRRGARLRSRPSRRDSRRASLSRPSSTMRRAPRRTRRHRSNSSRDRRRCRPLQATPLDRCARAWPPPAGGPSSDRWAGSVCRSRIRRSDIAPERRAERKSPDACARLQPVARARQDEFRLPVRAVETKARNRVADLRIGEAFGDLPAVGFEIDVRRRRHDGNDLPLRQRLQKLGNLFVLHRLVDEMDVEQSCGIGDRRVATGRKS